MATPYWGGLSNFQMPERDIFTNACQQTCGVSWTWLRRQIKSGAPSGTRETWKCSPQCTSSTNGGAILSSSCPSSSLEVVANEVFCGSCGYIPHVCWNGQWWTHRNAAQIPEFTISIWIGNYTHSEQDRPISLSCIPCCNNSEVRGIERAVAGIGTSSPVRAKQTTTHMGAQVGSWWLW